jgi:preprotein translocase subunit SecB
MNSIKSDLTLKAIVFDKIEFTRKGFKNDNDLSFGFKINIGQNQKDDYRVTIELVGEKRDEYSITISLSGFFSINDSGIDLKSKQDLINKNAVAILMPYLRSQLTLVTAQPNTDSVVLPPININKLMDNHRS